jgi:DNA processing protein
MSFTCKETIMTDSPFIRTLGNENLIDRLDHGVVVTGSRASSSYGNAAAQEFSARIVEAGHLVVTGSSFGIDSAAIHSVVAAGGAPIVVLSSGLDRPFPQANSPLLDAVVDQDGLLISLLDDGVAPSRQSFLQTADWLGANIPRTLIVEASTRSSSMAVVQKTWAAAHPVGAVPGPIFSATSAGTNKLIGDGALMVYDDVSLKRFLRCEQHQSDENI